jgi:hypothetical protein
LRVGRFAYFRSAGSGASPWKTSPLFSRTRRNNLPRYRGSQPFTTYPLLPLSCSDVGQRAPRATAEHLCRGDAGSVVMSVPEIGLAARFAGPSARGFRDPSGVNCSGSHPALDRCESGSCRRPLTGRRSLGRLRVRPARVSAGPVVELVGEVARGPVPLRRSRRVSRVPGGMWSPDRVHRGGTLLQFLKVTWIVVLALTITATASACSCECLGLELVPAATGSLSRLRLRRLF